MKNQKKKRISLFWWIGIAVVLLIGTLVWLNNQTTKATKQGRENLNQHINIDVQTFKSEGRGHVQEKVNYKTFPPTSGKHNPIPANYGFYEKEIPFEYLVHSLEHGDIVIYYHPNLSIDTLKKLKTLSTVTYKGSGVEVVPNSEIKEPIVVTAWTKMMTLPSFDEKKIKQFMYNYIYKGPEKLPMQQP